MHEATLDIAETAGIPPSTTTTLGPIRKPGAVIVCGTLDPHADVIRHALEDKGVPCRLLRVDDPQDIGFSIDEMGVKLTETRTWETGSVTSAAFFCRKIPALAFPMLAADPVGSFAAMEARAALEALYTDPRVNWTTTPNAILLANDKATQLRIAASVGLRPPEWCVTQNARQAEQFLLKLDAEYVAVKPLSSSVLHLGSRRLDLVVQRYKKRDLMNRIQDVTACPTLLQRWVEKRREYRVTVVAGQTFAVAMTPNSDVAAPDWSRIAPAQMQYKLVTLEQSLLRSVLRFVDSFRLGFAAIDLIEDEDGSIYFLENNPTGAWYWLEQSTGAPITEAVANHIAGRRRL